MRVVAGDAYLRSLSLPGAAKDLCRYYAVSTKPLTAKDPAASDEASLFGQISESEVTIVDVTDSRSRASTVCACVATEAHSNEFLYDGLVEPLLRELRSGAAAQAVVVIHGSLASRRHLLFQPFEGLLVRAAHELCRSGCKVTLSAVEQDEHNQLVDLVADQDSKPALMMMRARIPTIIENTDFNFTSVEDATLHDLTEQGMEAVFANLRDSKLSDVHHQVISLVAYDVASKTAATGRSTSMAQLPNRTIQFVSLVVNEQTKSMRNTRHCITNAASLLESRASSVPFTGSKITFLLKPAMLARQPGCWIAAIAPETPSSKQSRETFRDAFSLVQTAQRIHASKTGRFAFKSASSKALLRAPSIRKGSNSVTALLAEGASPDEDDEENVPAAATTVTNGARALPVRAVQKQTVVPPSEPSVILPSSSANVSDDAVNYRPGVAASPASASRDIVEQKLKMLQQEVPPVFSSATATGRAPSEEPRPRDAVPAAAAAPSTGGAVKPTTSLVRSKSATTLKDADRLEWQRQQFIALSRAQPGEIVVATPRRAMLDAGLNTSMGVQSPPSGLLRQPLSTRPASQPPASAARTPSGALSEQYLGKPRATAKPAQDVPAPAKSASVASAGSQPATSGRASGGPRWEVAQQFETYKQVMEGTVTRLRGDVEAYANEVKSLRAELLRRDKQSRQSDVSVAKAHQDAKEAAKRAAQAELEKQRESEERRHDVAALTKQRNEATHKVSVLQRQVQDLSDQLTDAEAHHSRMLAAASRGKSHATMFTQTTISQGAATALQSALAEIQRASLTAVSRDTSLVAGQSSTKGTQTLNPVQVDDIEEVSRLRLLAQELRDEASAQRRFVAAAEEREAILQSRLEVLEQELSNRDEAEVGLKTQLLRAEQALRLEKADREREQKEKMLSRMSTGTQASGAADDRAIEMQEELRLWHQKCRDAEDQADELLANVQAVEQERSLLISERDELEDRCAAMETRLSQIVAHHEREKSELLAALAATQQPQSPLTALPRKAPVSAGIVPPSTTARVAQLPGPPSPTRDSSPPTLTRNSSRIPPIPPPGGQSPAATAASPGSVPSPAPVRQLSAAPSVGPASVPQIITSLKALPPGVSLVKGAAGKGPPPRTAPGLVPPPPAPITSIPSSPQPAPAGSPKVAAQGGSPAVNASSPRGTSQPQTFESYMRQDPAARIMPPAPTSLPRRSPSAST